jgi:hypothetical protein
MIRMASRLSVCADAPQNVDISDQTENDEKSGDKRIGGHF